MRARTAVATVVGTLVLTTGVASAAGLSWSPARLGAQTAAVVACTPTLASPSAFKLNADGRVESVTVSVPGTGCPAGNVHVSLRSASAVVGSGRLGMASCAARTCVVPIGELPGLEAVTAAHVLVVGS